MKNVITVLALCFAASISGQNKNLKGDVSINDVKVENFKIAVEVDSIEDIESTFSIEDLEKILSEAEENEAIIFSIKCNGRKLGNEVKSHVKYEIKGNTNEKQKFVDGIKKVRASAIKYYKSKQ